jgi:hypothetical protein
MLVGRFGPALPVVAQAGAALMLSRSNGSASAHFRWRRRI